MTNDLYREEVLSHYASPQNCQKPSRFDYMASLANSLCGDKITVYLQVKNHKINKIYYQIKGCAISVYSASLLSEKLKNKATSQIMNISNDEILTLLKLTLTPTRAKCALLPIMAIKKALT